MPYELTIDKKQYPGNSASLTKLVDLLYEQSTPFYKGIYGFIWIFIFYQFWSYLYELLK